MHDESWKKIFNDYLIDKHDFSKKPFTLTAEQIKRSTHKFKTTGEKEVRILCKQDSRDARPNVFNENELFLLPVKNGTYVVLRGEGYVDIPKVTTPTKIYNSKLDFILDTAKIGNSEMQHLDFAYASSLIRTFMEDETLVLTIRGRKYTPRFDFVAGKYKQKIETESVQTEVDGGYEGKEKVVLVEAKSSGTTDTIIRQLYYPYRQWKSHTSKEVVTVFFEKQGQEYSIWQFGFTNEMEYNSIKLIKSAKYKIVV